jgi:hypothetical protein
MIMCVSIDSWNSVDAIQKLSQRGFNAIQLSVDRTMGPYECFKMGLYENRVSYYAYAPLLEELRELEHDKVKQKVDHPKKGAKDTADAVAGVTWTLTENAARMPVEMLKGISASEDQWMIEHQQAALASQYGSGRVETMSSLADEMGMLPPLLPRISDSDDDGGWWH